MKREDARARTASSRGRAAPRKSTQNQVIWHRPLSQVIEDAVVRLTAGATSLAISTLAVGSHIGSRTLGKPRSRALTVNGAPKQTGPGRSLSLVQAVRSASLTCVNWFRPTPVATAPIRRPPPPRPVPPPAPRQPFAPAVGSAPVPFHDGRRASSPADVQIETFMQKLYTTAEHTLFYNPSGMGALWVQSASGSKVAAGPEAKWYFLAVLKRFEELGEVASRLNPKYTAMTKSFADALLAHGQSDPVWKDIVADDPRHVARCFAGLDKPTHVVIDIPESSIQRVSASAGATSDSTVVSA